MPDVHFTNLLIVVAAGLLAPLALGFFPRVRLPAIVLEIVLGIAIGPSGLGWVAAASIAEFWSIILLSLFFSTNGSTGTAGTLILLGGFGLVVLLVGLAVAGVEHSMSLAHVLQRLQDTTAEMRVRAAFVLLIGFAALADTVGLETILGAFAAGALLSLIDRDQAKTHPELRVKLEAVGFGVFIPIFFVTSGVRFDLDALFANGSTVARVPVFLLALYAVRGLPALVYLRLLGPSRSLSAGFLQSTSLTFIVSRDADRARPGCSEPGECRRPDRRGPAVGRDLADARIGAAASATDSGACHAGTSGRGGAPTPSVDRLARPSAPQRDGSSRERPRRPRWRRRGQARRSRPSRSPGSRERPRSRR